jgi:F-type H+-transporting ATPase subunit a
MLEQGHAATSQAAEKAQGGFNAGDVIIGHVSNATDHPLIHLPKVFGIDMSVTKHVFMIWLVSITLFVVITAVVRRYVSSGRLVPKGAENALEIVVTFVREGVARPSIGGKWIDTWTPLLLTFFFFILGANAIGLLPIFDVLGLVDHYLIHSPEHSFLKNLIHGSSTATGNYNVTAGLAMVSFFAIIAAGTMAHGFIKHWMNLAPAGHPWPLYILLIPLEFTSMLVRPFALTMRLAANMTGGHIAILAIMSVIFIFAEAYSPALGMTLGVPSVILSSLISALEIIVVIVQAYVFTLLTAVFIGMAIHAHH